MTKYEDLTHEDKQAALDEAHEIMKSDAERLEGIKKYVERTKARYTTPILNEEDLSFLIGLAEKGCRND